MDDAAGLTHCRAGFHAGDRMTSTPLWTRRAALGSLLGTPLLASCSAVGAFNAIVPSEPGVKRVVDGASYGPEARQKLDLYVPVASVRNAPVVQFIYGGSWNSGERASYAFVGEALAARGIVTAVVDTRLVPEVRFPAFVEDSVAATVWLKANLRQHGGDPGRIVVMGHSSGAYNAAMVAVSPMFTRQAGLGGRVYAGLVGLAGPYDFLPLDVSDTTEAFGSYPDLPRTQPIIVATRGAPPSFLATGAEDTTVYPRNTHALAKRLRDLGVPVVEKTYPGIGHAGILTAMAGPFRDRAPVLDDVVSFVKGRPAA
jgi:acetyl esterase/lipase